MLCVDDEPNVPSGYQRILRRTAEMIVAPSGAQFLQLAAAKQPCQDMADRHMPGMDGIELLQRIRT